MDSYDVARRFSGTLPGYELVAARDVFLPSFKVTLEVFAEQRDDLPVIDEFVLRAVSAGLGDLASISSLLGVDDALARQAVVSATSQGLLDYEAGPSDGTGRLDLTLAGQDFLEANGPGRAQRTGVDLLFDRLTWLPSGSEMRFAVRPRDIAASGIREVPPRRKRRITLDDLEVDAVQEAVRELPGQGVRRMQILSIRHVSQYRTAVPALMLVYVSEDDSMLRIEFAVDGRLSGPHGEGLAQIGGPERLGMTLGPRAVLNRRPMLEAVAGRRLGVSETRQIWSEVDSAVEEAATQERASGLLQATEQGNRSRDAWKRRDEAIVTAERLGVEVESASVRELETFELDFELLTGLGKCRRRLLIVGLRLLDGSMTGDVLGGVELACQRRVAVTLVVAGERGCLGTKGSVGLTARLDALAAKFSNLEVLTDRAPEGGVLVWDDCVIESTRGWPGEESVDGHEWLVRREESVRIADPTYAADRYTSLLQELR